MITRDNISDVLNSLTPEQIEGAMYGEYVSLYITGNFGWVILNVTDQYNEEHERETMEAGGLYCDSCTFMDLLRENNIEF